MRGTTKRTERSSGIDLLAAVSAKGMRHPELPPNHCDPIPGSGCTISKTVVNPREFPPVNGNGPDRSGPLGCLRVLNQYMARLNSSMRALVAVVSQFRR